MNLNDFIAGVNKVLAEEGVILESGCIISMGESGFNNVKSYDFASFDPDSGRIVIHDGENTYFIKKSE